MFQDRKEAGLRLAGRLAEYSGRKDATLLALPRGGVVVGFEMASALALALDVLIVRKIGFPGQPELAIGAVAETGAVIINRDILALRGTSEAYVSAEIERQKWEINRRVGLYRGGRAISGLKGRIALLVDDGVATGATMKAAIKALREQSVGKLIACLPVAPVETAAELEGMADELICLEKHADFIAVGNYYRNFSQTTDGEVVDLLHRAARKAA
jgi:putative phosphoribosyl transferase